MYSEQMMREQGFDADAELPAEHAHRRDLAGLPDHPRRPDAPRRDLDRRRHPVPRDETSFEAPNARAEVRRYTYTPTYQLSYLLGKVLLLQLRADEQARLGNAFSLRDFHDTLMRNGSLPISFHRRLLRESLGAAAAPQRTATTARTAAAAPPGPPEPDRVQVIPSIDLDRGRSRVVFWPGRRPASAPRPTGRSGSPSSSSPRAPG